jgi:hypothetical protein
LPHVLHHTSFQIFRRGTTPSEVRLTGRQSNWSLALDFRFLSFPHMSIQWIPRQLPSWVGLRTKFHQKIAASVKILCCSYVCTHILRVCAAPAEKEVTKNECALIAVVLCTLTNTYMTVRCETAGRAQCRSSQEYTYSVLIFKGAITRVCACGRTYTQPAKSRRSRISLRYKPPTA